MNDAKPFLCGVIEGFYGRPWPFETRLAYAGYLQTAGLNTYLYCPKSDPILRKRWPDKWSKAQWEELTSVFAAYRERELLYGVGLSPFNLYRHYGPKEREMLRAKVGYLEQLEAPLLAILFDDMPGDLEGLASRQAEIVSDVGRWLPGVRLLVCPTYYSHDSVLQTHFGPMPPNYWAELGAELDADIEIFWTGNAVCSDAISVEDVAQINESLGRQVTLWDNYPVNDGAKRSNFLYTDPLSERAPELRGELHGHLCNPMNQGLLSLPALSGLSALYGCGGLNERSLPDILGPAVWAQLGEHAEDFQQLGLTGLGEAACARIAAELTDYSGVAVTELRQWLTGDFRFDPACLTD